MDRREFTTSAASALALAGRKVPFGGADRKPDSRLPAQCDLEFLSALI